MEYPKIANLLESASNQASKFRTKNWAEINDESSETCNWTRTQNHLVRNRTLNHLAKLAK